jgi:hypothetical protein
LQNADAFMLLIGSMLHLQHLLFELGMGGSIGKTLYNLLVLELATFQVSRLEEHFLNIGRV